jgi:RimJ/RimL family protein N-acetyltransferase
MQRGCYEYYHVYIRTTQGATNRGLTECAASLTLVFCCVRCTRSRIGEPEYWGSGYGTDALLLLVDYAFDELDIRKIWLGTMGLNARVMRQMEKVGFTLEVRQRQAIYADSVWYEQLIYGLLREEWPGRPALVEKLGLTARV